MKLEVGVGAGKYTLSPKVCPNCDVTGDIEVPLRKLSLFIRLEASHLPFKDECFEEVYFSHIIEHVFDPFQMLKEAHRVLQNRGKVHVWVPNLMDSSATADKNHKHVFNVLTLRKILEDSGFTAHSYVMSIGNRLGVFKKLIQLILLFVGAELYVVGEKQ